MRDLFSTDDGLKDDRTLAGLLQAQEARAGELAFCSGTAWEAGEEASTGKGSQEASTACLRCSARAVRALDLVGVLLRNGQVPRLLPPLIADAIA
jgi:hypothetical protein